MADFTFWHNLGEEFKNLDPGQVLRIVWQCTTGDPRPFSYRLEGDSEWLCLSFKRLVQIAVMALGESGNQDQFTVWCDKLRKNDPDPRNKESWMGPEVLDDGRHIYHQMGTIPNPGEASATLCIVLEMEESEIEPKNAKEGAVPAEPSAQPLSGLDWADVEIRFLSEFQVYLTGRPEPQTYADIGFEDLRNGKPNLAWATLYLLAKRHGTISVESTAGYDRAKLHKRVQAIREILRERFAIKSDPLPFVDGVGYQAAFKIECSPAAEN